MGSLNLSCPNFSSFGIPNSIVYIVYILVYI